MTVYSAISSELPFLRAEAEALMTDSGTMRRSTGHTAQDEDTGSESEVFADVFTSKCKIQARNLQAGVAEAGERTVVTVRLELHLPVAAPAVQVGDVWEVTSVGALSDMQMLGSKFRVVAPVTKSYATARRLEVEEVVS